VNSNEYATAETVADAPGRLLYSRRNARSGLQAMSRRAAPMLACPASRKMVMTRLLRVAMTCGPAPVREFIISDPATPSAALLTVRTPMVATRSGQIGPA